MYCTVASAFVRTSPIQCKTHSKWSSYHTTNFRTKHPAVEIRKRGAYVRTCSCIPPFAFVKRQANGFLTTVQISAQSVKPFPRCGKGGTSARAHVRKCRCTPPMTYVICIAAGSLNTHQVWSLSVEPFLSYGLAANFDTIHVARATCEGDPLPQMSQLRL